MICIQNERLSFDHGHHITRTLGVYHEWIFIWFVFLRCIWLRVFFDGRRPSLSWKINKFVLVRPGAAACGM